MVKRLQCHGLDGKWAEGGVGGGVHNLHMQCNGSNILAAQIRKLPFHAHSLQMDADRHMSTCELLAHCASEQLLTMYSANK